jgi:hypothetical protein
MSDKITSAKSCHSGGNRNPVTLRVSVGEESLDAGSGPA